MRSCSVFVVVGLGLASLVACSGSERAAPAAQAAPTPPTPTPPPTPTAAEPVVLAGGYLAAQLPAGALVPPESPARPADILALVTHSVRRPGGTLHIQSLDVEQRVTADFAADAAALERRARCPEEGATWSPEPPLVAPEGFAVVTYFPDATCFGGPPPAARLFIATPARVVIQVELWCEAEEACLPDRREVLEAFVASLRSAPPPSTAGGARFLGPSPELGFSLTVPEGFVVRNYQGEDSDAFVLTRPTHVDGPTDVLSIAFLFSSSPNTLREDYAAQGERARTRMGRVAGREVELLELSGATRRRTLARLLLSALTIDVVVQASTDEVRAQLLRALAEAQLRDPDEEELEPEDEPLTE